MNIYLYDSCWATENYIIHGDFENGYYITEKNKDEIIYENISFEACLIWIFND